MKNRNKSSEKKEEATYQKESIGQPEENHRHDQIEVIKENYKPEIRKKRVHPRVLWGLSDEEWDMFGDRFPIQYEKVKLLGRYDLFMR